MRTKNNENFQVCDSSDQHGGHLRLVGGVRAVGYGVVVTTSVRQLRCLAEHRGTRQRPLTEMAARARLDGRWCRRAQRSRAGRLGFLGREPARTARWGEA